MYSTESKYAIKFICEKEKNTMSYGKQIFNLIKNSKGEITETRITESTKIISYYMRHVTEIQLDKRESEELPFSFDLLLRLLRTKCFTKLAKIKIDNIFLQKENIKILLKELTNLEEITITNCKLHDPKFVFDIEYGNFKNLKVLDLSNNLINEFIMDTTIAPNLTNLDLSFNSLRHIDFGGWEHGMKYLNIEENFFNKFPVEILCFSELIYLNIRQNEISEIPESIQKLVSLQNLYASSNKIKILPQSIKVLTYLRELDISDNLIDSIPKLEDLKNLKKINLSNNSFANFNLVFTNLTNTNVEELDLSGNKMATIYSPTAHNLPSIKIVNLSNTSATMGTFNIFKNAEEINFSKNKLSYFYTKESFNNLAKLDLSHNELTTISDDIINLYSVKTLNLSNNKIPKIPEDKIYNLMFLQHLNLEHNKIIDIPESLKFMSLLTSVNVSDNPINYAKVCNVQMLRYLNNLDKGTKSPQDNIMDEYDMLKLAKTVNEIINIPNKTNLLEISVQPTQEKLNFNQRTAPISEENYKGNNTTAKLDSYNKSSYEQKINYNRPYAGYNQSKYSPQQKSFISIRIVLINVLRDFIVNFPQQ